MKCERGEECSGDEEQKRVRITSHKRGFTSFVFISFTLKRVVRVVQMVGRI